MSLILDALNRSRQDAEQVPGLATEHHRDLLPAASSGWRGQLPWLGLGLALVIIAWLLLDRSGDGKESDAAVVSAPVVKERPTQNAPAPPPAAPTDTPAPDNRAVTAGETSAGRETAAEMPFPEEKALPAPQPEAVGTSPEKSLPKQDEAVTALYADRQQASVAQAQPAQKTPARPDVAAVAPHEPASASGDVREQPVDIEAMVSRAQQEVENARLAGHPAPFITDLSQQTKDRIPTIFYQRHDFRNSAGSTVTLNGNELRVGGKAASGVTVKEILPDSVVLGFDGTEFRLRALNSWINL